MLYGSIKPSIDLLQTRNSLEETIPMHQLILEDEEGNRVVCNIRSSQFFSFLSSLRSTVTNAQIEREVQERLAKERHANRGPAFKGLTIQDLASNSLTATEAQQAQTSNEREPANDPRMSLTLEDMELKRKDTETVQRTQEETDDAN
jgi:hypothetical protein